MISWFICIYIYSVYYVVYWCVVSTCGSHSNWKCLKNISKKHWRIPEPNDIWNRHHPQVITIDGSQLSILNVLNVLISFYFMFGFPRKYYGLLWFSTPQDWGYDVLNGHPSNSRIQGGPPSRWARWWSVLPKCPAEGTCFLQCLPWLEDMGLSWNRATQELDGFMENPTNMHDLGVPLFQETSVFGITHCKVFHMLKSFGEMI